MTMDFGKLVITILEQMESETALTKNEKEKLKKQFLKTLIKEEQTHE